LPNKQNQNQKQNKKHSRIHISRGWQLSTHTMDGKNVTLTSTAKGRFSHWTPGIMSGSLLTQPSLLDSPGGFARVFSKSREKRWSSRALFSLSQNAL